MIFISRRLYLYEKCLQKFVVRVCYIYLTLYVYTLFILDDEVSSILS